MYSTKKHQKGFTLIELLVVIAIIGLLASIVLASLNSARVKGRDARRVADMKDLQTALELYFSNNSKYPVAATTGSVATGLAALVTDKDISTIPDDPLGNTYHYTYITDSTGTKYCLSAELEGAAPAGASASCTNSLSNSPLPATATINYSVNP